MGIVATVRIFKSYLSRANKTWVNTYEICSGNLADSAGYESLPSVETLNPVACADTIALLVGFEKQIHLPQIQFINATVSTWLPDSDPYDPFALYTQELSGTGERPEFEVGDEDMVDLRNVLRISRKGALGKRGMIEYRGCLEKGDIKNAGGKWELDMGLDMPGYITAAVADLNGLLTATEEASYRMCLIGGTLHKEPVERMKAGILETVTKRTYIAPWHLRKVTTVAYHSVGVRKQDNKSFDRP